ncbi:hypothetical protein MASR2M15_06900 [Anaerolineales bacterium]
MHIHCQELNKIRELERVALTEDLPEQGLKTGNIGMIIHVYGDHKGYKIEFVTVLLSSF